MSVVDYISNLDRPSYAPSFNNVFLEDVIPGYRTLDVSGRESFESEVNERSSEIRDGARFVRNRRSPREITVKFAVTTDSNAEYRQAIDKLKGMFLNYGEYPIEQKEFTIIFLDEQDKFYKGVITNVSTDKLVNYKSGSGEFTIHCSDPCKYSVTEYYALPVYDSSDGYYKYNIDYDGTYNSYPKFNAVVASSDDFLIIQWISFINQYGRILQFGTPERVEIPEDEIPLKSEIIFDNTFDQGAIASQPGVTNRQSSNWVICDGSNTNFDLGNGWRHNTLDQLASVIQCSTPFSARGYARTSTPLKFLYTADYGNDNFEGWHGPVITRYYDFADSNNNNRHKSGTLEFKHRFVTGSNDYGEFIATLNYHYPVSGGIRRHALAKIVIFKNLKGSNISTCNLMIYDSENTIGKLAYTFQFDSGRTGSVTKATSEYTAGPAVHRITKIEDTITFDINGQQFAFRSADIKDLTVDSITFAFGKYKDEIKVTENYLLGAKFTAHNVKDIKDIPEKITPNGHLEIDVSKAEVIMDGVPKMDLGAPGNDWETFFLKPGLNEIVFNPQYPLKYTNYDLINDITGETTHFTSMYPVVLRYRKVYL